jgi:outer membrane protein assembly factor BamB
LTNSDLSTNHWGTWTVLLATNSLTAAPPFSLTNASNMFFEASVTLPALLWATPLSCLGDEWGLGLDASPALSQDGSTVYIPSTSNMLYALDANYGTIKGFTIYSNTSGVLSSSAAISSNGDIYVGSTDGYLYSFTTNLTPNWSNDLLSIAGGVRYSDESSVYGTPTITAGGTIYVGTANSFPGNGFFSTNVNSSSNWLFLPQSIVDYKGNALNYGNVDSSAAVGTDGTIYFLAQDARLYALYPDGNVKWFLPIPASTWPDSSPAIAGDGSIVCGSDSPYVYSVNPDGTLRWFYHIPSTNDTAEAIFSSPVIDADETVYVGAGQPNSDSHNDGWYFPPITDWPTGIYAITNGSLKWSFTNVSGWVVGSCALGADGTVYAGASSPDHTYGTLYAIKNGVQEWSFQTSNDIVSSPVIGGDGGILISCEDSNVYKVAGGTTLADAPWPMFHHDPQHTGSLAGTNSPVSGCEPPFPNDGNFTSGYFSFSCMGRANTSWSVYASTDLVNWTNINKTITNDATGLGSFTDVRPVLGANQFYCLSNGCGSKVLGFVKFSMMPGTNLNLPGTNLISDPFYQVDDNALYISYHADNALAAPMNTVASLFTAFPSEPYGYTGILQIIPTNTTFANWTSDGFVTDTNNNNGNGYPQWLPNGEVTLLPGMGAMAVLPTNYSIAGAKFIGLVRESVTNQIHTNINYLGSALPIAGEISSVLGYTNATSGDLLLRWDPTNQVYVTYTNYGGTNWSTNEPSIGIAEGFILISSENTTWVQNCPSHPGN